MTTAGPERSTGRSRLREDRRWLWGLLAFVTLLAAGSGAWWLGLRWLLFLALAIVLLLVLHPLDCRLKWRLSPRGQRGEAWLRHGFGLLGLGVSGGPAGARVLVEIGPWRKVVFDSRTPAEPPAPPQAPQAPEAPGKKPSAPPEGKPPSAVVSEPPSTMPSSSAVKPPVEPAIADASEPTVSPASSASPSPEVPVETDSAAPAHAEPVSSEPPHSIAPANASPEKAAESGVSPVPSSEANAPSGNEPVIPKPVPSPATRDRDFDHDVGRLSPPPGARTSVDAAPEPAGPSLRERLRALRRRFRSIWQKIRKGYRLAREIWNRATEPCRRLLWNLWASFSLLGPRAHLRYGLSEPHIVGMIQGLLAPLAGVAMPLGALIRVEPVFTGPTIWCRGETGLRIHPWRVCWAFARLVAEREVILGARDAWRFWRARPTSEGPAEKEPPR